MKKVFGGLAILLVVGLVLASCSNPVLFGARSRAAGAAGIVWNGADDRDAAVNIEAVKNDARKNASGPKIASNAQSAEFPGLYFIWDSKQADNGYLKVAASVFEKYDTFILTAKESNSYWDFEISIQPGQAITADDCFVFFIPKAQEIGKNINMVFVSEFSIRPLAAQELNYTENPIDIPNPDRGFYSVQELTVPLSGGNPGSPSLNAGNITGTQVSVTPRITYMEFCLRNFSSNSPTNGRPRGPWAPTTAVRNYGTSQPLTESALNYVRTALTNVRNSEGVAIVKFQYDLQGYTYIDSGIWDMVVHDPEPGAPQGRAWFEALYADFLLQPESALTGQALVDAFEAFRNQYRLDHPAIYTEAGAESDSCGIPGHEEKNWVQYHYWQLGAVFREFEDCIMAVKGGTFGAWGEMHSSSYARTQEGYNWLMNTLFEYVPESRSILAHAGAAMGWYNVEYGTNYDFTNMPPAPVRGTPEQRIGMFNDSYSRGLDGDWYNDNGSLSEGYEIVGTGDPDDYDRTRVLTWIRGQRNFYGGETVGAGSSSFAVNPYPRFPSVPYEAAFAQTTHLNREYSSSTYGLWNSFIYNEANMVPYVTPHDGLEKVPIFDPVYNGRNGAEYMRDRLGYRLVVRDANASEWVAQNGTLRFDGKIQNVGFGYVVNKKNVAVILRPKAGGANYTALTDIDVRDWAPDLDSRATNTAAWRDFGFAISMRAFGDVPAGDYDILLKINDPKETHPTRRSVRFANNGAIWDTTLAANLIGSTTVK